MKGRCKIPRCNIYKNLWAGYDCYFFRLSTNGSMASGIYVHNAYGDWRVAFNTQFYDQDVKDPVHLPVVGKIDINQSIISSVLAAVEEYGVR